MEETIIYSNSVKGHIRHVDEILTTLGRAGVIIKMKNGTFLSSKVEHLVNAIRPDKLELDNAHTASLRQVKPLTTKSGLCSFSGAL